MANGGRGQSENKFKDVEDLQDLRPFEVDPLLRYLHVKGVAGLWVAVGSFGFVFFVALVASALSNNGFWAVSMSRSGFEDFLASFSEPDVGTTGTRRVPFLRDYASLVAAVTVACAPWFIYRLFEALTTLHSTLARNGCIEISQNVSVDEINDDIAALNERIAQHSQRLRIVLVVGGAVAALALLAALGMRNGGFSHLVNVDEAQRQAKVDDLYGGWWARPFLPGFYAWCLLGALGIYMVYVEAVVGLKYTWFLRKNRDRYRFRANAYDVDGYYGWQSVRTTFSFMLAGVASTALSLYPLYMFLKSSLPVWLIATLLLSYQGVVLYVSVAAALILRGHVRRAKNDAMSALVEDLARLRDASTLEDLLRRQMLSDELRYYRAIPNFPVVTKWTVLAGIVTLVSVIASLAQIFSVVRPERRMN